MAIEIKVPFLGDGIEHVRICTWHHKPGDIIAQGEDLVEVEADKAIFNIASEGKGFLKEILIPEGQEVSIGKILAIMESL